MVITRSFDKACQMVLPGAIIFTKVNASASKELDMQAKFANKNNKIVEDTKNFEVALLIEDLAQAKEISDVLRELGIYAHYYSDLDEFWVAANAQTPDFLIIDVKKMSQGETLFKNHPKVQNGSMAFAFYYSDSTKVLVNSTFKFNHYGLIKKEQELLGQLRCALRRRNQELRLIEENEKLQDRVLRLQKRSNRILQDSQETLSFQTQFGALLNVTSRVGKAKSRQDYMGQLMAVLSEWDACKSYGIYTLNQTDQKLVSPKGIKLGYESLPELWLARPGDKGIDSYAQEMACEVAFDVFDNEARAVNITGLRAYPEIMVIGKFDEASLRNFSWELFEERLSHAYAKLLFSEMGAKESNASSMSVWESFSYMDDMHFHQAQGMHKLVDIDFSRLLQVIKDKPGNRFFWKSFYGDFMAQLEDTLSGDFKVSAYGAQSCIVLIDKKYLEQDYQKLKAMVDDFQYWRYFQDTSMVMTKRMCPEVRLIAPSALNYIRQTQANALSAGQSVLEMSPSSFAQQTLNV